MYTQPDTQTYSVVSSIIISSPSQIKFLHLAQSEFYRFILIARSKLEHKSTTYNTTNEVLIQHLEIIN